VREGSVCTIRARFFDDQAIPTAPTTVRYRLRDVTNNRTIVDWTDLTPDLYVEVEISPDSNAIYNDRCTYQENAFVMQADPGLPTQWVDEVRYQVQNLKGFESR
jgi:hypothetical protein